MNNRVVVKKIVVNDALGQSRQIDRDPFTELYNKDYIDPEPEGNMFHGLKYLSLDDIKEAEKWKILSTDEFKQITGQDYTQ